MHDGLWWLLFLKVTRLDSRFTNLAHQRHAGSKTAFPFPIFCSLVRLKDGQRQVVSNGLQLVEVTTEKEEEDERPDEGLDAAVDAGRTEVHRQPTLVETGPSRARSKNSPSRWRFRPLSPLTFRFRVRPSR